MLDYTLIMSNHYKQMANPFPSRESITSTFHISNMHMFETDTDHPNHQVKFMREMYNAFSREDYHNI
jgi:hypothetical protein